MKTLIQSLMDRTPGRWDVVLVIGAGAGSSVASLRQGDPAHLLLTEAQPDQAELLARAIDPERGEESRAVAVREGGSEAILRQCSNARFNSFGIATGRASLLPNLSDTGELRVPAVALRDLVADAGIEPTGRNLLVVESPGQLAPLLREPEALQAFSAIVAKVGEVPLYEGDPDPAALLEILLEAGFDPAGSDPEAIYPVAVLGFARNDARVENKRLRARAEAAERELRAEVELGVRREKEAAHIVAEHQESIKKLQQEVSALLQASNQQAQARAVMGKQVADLSERCGSYENKLKEALKQVESERNSAEASRDACGKANAELTQHRVELDRVKALVSEFRKSGEDFKAALDQARHECAEQAKALEENKAVLHKTMLQSQERGARLLDLERENARAKQQQEWLGREMAKAEGQLELIRDLMRKAK